MKAIEKLKNQENKTKANQEKKHDFRTCKDADCSECQDLIDQDIIMGCDGPCGEAHLKSDWWHLFSDGETFCEKCYNDFNECPF